MGRVVQGPQLSDRRYQIGVPANPRDLPRIGDSNGQNVTYDIEEVLRASHRIVDESSNDARVMINEARERSKAIVSKALDMASELEAKGYEDGLLRAKEEQEEAVREVAVNARKQLDSVIDDVRRQRQAFFADAEDGLLRLAFDIAKKIIGIEIERTPDVVVNIARGALKRLSERDQITIRVCPNDLDVLRSHRDAFLHEADLSDLRIIADPRVTRGGVIVETDGGSIDGRIDAQLSVAQDAIFTLEPESAV